MPVGSPAVSDPNGDRIPSVAGVDGRWMPVALFAAVVFVASVLPVPSVPAVAEAVGVVTPGGSTAGSGERIPFGLALTDPFHAVGYAVLAAVAARATGRGGRSLVLAAAAAVAVGFGIELVQSTIPWRTFAWGDAAVNALGAGAGVAAVAVARRVAAARSGGTAARDR